MADHLEVDDTPDPSIPPGRIVVREVETSSSDIDIVTAVTTPLARSAWEQATLEQRVWAARCRRVAYFVMNKGLPKAKAMMEHPGMIAGLRLYFAKELAEKRAAAVATPPPPVPPPSEVEAEPPESEDSPAETVSRELALSPPTSPAAAVTEGPDVRSLESIGPPAVSVIPVAAGPEGGNPTYAIAAPAFWPAEPSPEMRQALTAALVGERRAAFRSAAQENPPVAPSAVNPSGLGPLWEHLSASHLAPAESRPPRQGPPLPPVRSVAAAGILPTDLGPFFGRPNPWSCGMRSRENGGGPGAAAEGSG